MDAVADSTFAAVVAVVAVEYAMVLHYYSVHWNARQLPLHPTPYPWHQILVVHNSKGQLVDVGVLPTKGYPRCYAFDAVHRSFDVHESKRLVLGQCVDPTIAVAAEADSCTCQQIHPFEPHFHFDYEYILDFSSQNDAADTSVAKVSTLAKGTYGGGAMLLPRPTT